MYPYVNTEHFECPPILADFRKAYGRMTLTGFVIELQERIKAETDEDIKAFFQRLFEVFNGYLLCPNLMRYKTMARIILNIADEFQKEKIYHRADEVARIGKTGKTIDDMVIDW